MIKNITIVGLGLIGGSLAHALKLANVAETIIGYDLNPVNLQFALQHQMIDKSCDASTFTTDPAIIFIATPPKQFNNALLTIKPFLTSTTVISDCVSIKSSTVLQAKEILDSYFSNFVPGHPMAGSEKNGIAHAKANLFQQRTVILTPEAETNAHALNQIIQLWQTIEAKIHLMTADEHDEVVAYTSHLPHLLAFAFLNSMDAKQIEQIKCCIGKGFEDFTRIGKASPDLWTDILSENRNNLLQQVQKFKQQLYLFENLLLENNDPELIEAIAKSQVLKKQIN